LAEVDVVVLAGKFEVQFERRAQGFFEGEGDDVESGFPHEWLECVT
jgi:hypothetical protein